MGARSTEGLVNPSSPRPKPSCGQRLPMSPSAFGRPKFERRSASPDCGEVHDFPVNNDGGIISIVGALDPRCLSPPKFDDSERGRAPLRIAIASLSRPSRGEACYLHHVDL